jgi:hypothetical protein
MYQDKTPRQYSLILTGGKTQQNLIPQWQVSSVEYHLTGVISHCPSFFFKFFIFVSGASGPNSGPFITGNTNVNIWHGLGIGLVNSWFLYSGDR